MSVLPISIVRTSQPLSQQRLLFQLNSDQIALQRKYDELSSGHRVQHLSDDPSATNRAIGLHRGIDRGNQLVRNASSTAGFYQSADDALSRVDSALIQARGVAVEAAQTVVSEDERAAFAITIDQAINSVLAAGNGIFRDHQLLGGFLNSGSALAFDDADILFSGTTAIGRTAVGAGDPTDINITGYEGIGVYSVIMEGEPLNATLDNNARLVDLRQGQGVTPGVVRFSGGGNWTDLDLRSAATVGDMLDLISSVELEGRPIVATVVGSRIQVEYADGLAGTLAIVDANGSTLAQELAINNPAGVTAPPILGAPVPPRITPQTQIADLADGAGLDLSGGILISQGDSVFPVNFDNAQSLSDVLIAINRSGADVRAELNEAEGRILVRSLRSGVDYSIGENGGTAATELGIRTATAETRLDSLGKGRGVLLNSQGADFAIVRPDGVQLDINLEGAETIADVIDAIRTHPLNQDTLRVLVDLNDIGNGLQIKAPPGAGPLTINQFGNSNAGIRLGLIPPGTNTVTGGIIGAVDTISGVDYAPREADGALDTLLRLKEVVRSGDIPEITRLQAKLDIDLDRSSRARGRVGIWAQTLDQLKSVTEKNVIQLRSQLSDEIDADLASVISELNQRQVAIEASMRLIGQTSQLTILNFL